MAVQINCYVTVDAIGMRQGKIVRKTDIFYIGFCQCRFKVPYSTDISRGY